MHVTVSESSDDVTLMTLFHNTSTLSCNVSEDALTDTEVCSLADSEPCLTAGCLYYDFVDTTGK